MGQGIHNAFTVRRDPQKQDTKKSRSKIRRRIRKKNHRIIIIHPALLLQCIGREEKQKQIGERAKTHIHMIYTQSSIHIYIYIAGTRYMRCCRRRARRILLDYHRPNRQSHTNLDGPSSESFGYYIRDHKLSLHIITRLLFEYNIILSLYTRRSVVYTRIIFGRGADGKIPINIYIYIQEYTQVYTVL